MREGQPGRIVISARVRAAHSLEPGAQLNVRVDGFRAVLERQRDAATELRGLAAQVSPSWSLIEELLAQRRRLADNCL